MQYRKNNRSLNSPQRSARRPSVLPARRISVEQLERREMLAADLQPVDSTYMVTVPAGPAAYVIEHVANGHDSPLRAELNIPFGLDPAEGRSGGAQPAPIPLNQLSTTSIPSQLPDGKPLQFHTVSLKNELEALQPRSSHASNKAPSTSARPQRAEHFSGEQPIGPRLPSHLLASTPLNNAPSLNSGPHPSSQTSSGGNATVRVLGSSEAVAIQITAPPGESWRAIVAVNANANFADFGEVVPTADSGGRDTFSSSTDGQRRLSVTMVQLPSQADREAPLVGEAPILSLPAEGEGLEIDLGNLPPAEGRDDVPLTSSYFEDLGGQLESETAHLLPAQTEALLLQATLETLRGQTETIDDVQELRALLEDLAEPNEPAGEAPVESVSGQEAMSPGRELPDVTEPTSTTELTERHAESTAAADLLGNATAPYQQDDGMIAMSVDQVQLPASSEFQSPRGDSGGWNSRIAVARPFEPATVALTAGMPLPPAEPDDEPRIRDRELSRIQLRPILATATTLVGGVFLALRRHRSKQHDLGNESEL